MTAGVDALRDPGRAHAAEMRARDGRVEELGLPGLPPGFARLVAPSTAADEALTGAFARSRRCWAALRPRRRTPGTDHDGVTKQPSG